LVTVRRHEDRPRPLLTAVEGFENEDEEAAALDEYADRVIEQANDELAERSVEKLEEREGAASTAVKKMSYAEAADRIMFLLRMGKYAVKSESETGTPGNEGDLGNNSPHQRTKNSAQPGCGPAQPAAKIQKFPDNYPVLREPAPASRTRRQRGG
jgi:hypothetical protein